MLQLSRHKVGRLDLAIAREKLALPGRESREDIPYAPPTPPGDELPGDHITEEKVKEWPQDKFRRSKWKTNGPSVKAWLELEEEHEKNRSHPLPVEDWMEPGFYAFNSVMGSGKTAVAAHKAELRYRAGWPVFHTGAFKFGNYIRRGEMYHFCDALPAGAFIFCDEVHAVFHASTSGANRENAFSDSSTSMRKDKLIFVGASASKRLPPIFRQLVDYAGYVERQYFPVLRAFPPACLRTEWLGPRPWDREDLREELGYADREKVKRWHEFYDPLEMEETFKLFDSWLKVQVMYGDGYGADEERSDRLGLADREGVKYLSPDYIYGTVVAAYADGFFREEEQAYEAAKARGVDLRRNTLVRRETSVSMDKLVGIFARAGYTQVKASGIRQALEGYNCGCGTKGVPVENLIRAYERREEEEEWEDEE